MILVVLGTEKYSFIRPLQQIEELAKEGVFGNEEIIVQSGFTEFNSQYMQLYPFLSKAELQELYKKANYIISHSGTGSVLMGCKLNKKIIVIPRLKKYREHIDNHQLELVDAFEEKGYVLAWRDGMSLFKILESIEDFSPQKFISGKEK
ncbi:glycosyltransferase [Anaerophaga thermohalophila]|uniref:glycosyltransferase n=1 Tax=Anaerophaga thermohalophila TaxID=177400 RepID=UPI00035EA6EF|nr:glycosyltransferase [Anaerophaga thermohalophila]